MFLSTGLLIFNIVVAQSEDTPNKLYVTNNCGSDVFVPDIYCHNFYVANDIPTIFVRKFRFPENSIFFIETSCGGGLNFRQACAVESAVRAHPLKKVFVLFAGPVGKNCLKISPMFELLKYKNLKFYRIYVEDFVRNTPVEVLIANGALNQSSYPVHHTSDILRFVALYKYGGTYLDLDVIVAKPLDHFTGNWLGRQSETELSSSLISLAKFGLGQRISYTILRRMKDSFRVDSWQYNRVGVMTEVLQIVCGTRDIEKMNNRTCPGLNVFDATYFFPIPYENCDKYFSQHDGPNPNKPFAFHIWNHLTQNETIYSDSLYARLIKLYCPTIHNIME